MLKYSDELFQNRPITKPIHIQPRKIQDRVYELDVELYKPSNNIISSNAIFVKGDVNTSIISASIKLNSKSFNLSGYTVSINIQEGINMIETFICDIIDIDNGKVEIRLPAIYVDEVGNNIFELLIQKGTKVLSSQKYSYIVIDSLGEGFIGDTEVEMSALQNLIRQVQSQINTIDKFVKDLEVNATDIDDIINMIG